MRVITTVLLVLIILLGFTFAGLNAEPVALNYYIGNVKLPLSLLLVLVLIIGCLLSLIASLIFGIKLKNENRRLRQRLKIVEAELANLRTIPLKDAH
jgi:putative membrane protein